jgi:hypothetical protein
MIVRVNISDPFNARNVYYLAFSYGCLVLLRFRWWWSAAVKFHIYCESCRIIDLHEVYLKLSSSEDAKIFVFICKELPSRRILTARTWSIPHHRQHISGKESPIQLGSLFNFRALLYPKLNYSRAKYFLDLNRCGAPGSLPGIWFQLNPRMQESLSS